jgi:hypothetical protein
LPWLAGKQAPRLTAERQGRVVIIRQDSPYFVLPVTFEASSAKGSERQRIWIQGAETRVSFSSDLAHVQIDPDRALLLRR